MSITLANTDLTNTMVGVKGSVSWEQQAPLITPAMWQAELVPHVLINNQTGCNLTLYFPIAARYYKVVAGRPTWIELVPNEVSYTYLVENIFYQPAVAILSTLLYYPGEVPTDADIQPMHAGQERLLAVPLTIGDNGDNTTRNNVHWVAPVAGNRLTVIDCPIPGALAFSGKIIAYLYYAFLTVEIGAVLEVLDFEIQAAVQTAAAVNLAGPAPGIRAYLASPATGPADHFQYAPGNLYHKIILSWVPGATAADHVRWSLLCQASAGGPNLTGTLMADIDRLNITQGPNPIGQPKFVQQANDLGIY